MRQRRKSQHHVEEKEEKIGRSFLDTSLRIHKQLKEDHHHVVVPHQEENLPKQHDPGSRKELVKPNGHVTRSLSLSPHRKSEHPKSSTMDLNYITEKLISVSFSDTIDEPTYKQHLEEMAHMLKGKHGDKYVVFNLSEKCSDLARINNRVEELGWHASLAPPLEKLCTICKALNSWMNSEIPYVVVLHSRGGVERIGVVLAAYLHYCSICSSADQPLDRFTMKRYYDDKIGTLPHPSQSRYVNYFSGLLSESIRMNTSPVFLHHVTVEGVPKFDSSGGCQPFLKIYQGTVPLTTTSVYRVTPDMKKFTFSLDKGLQLRGDILVKCYHKSNTAREVIFRCQFHTCAVSQPVLSFQQQDLDDACYDMRFPLDGKVSLHFNAETIEPGTVPEVIEDSRDPVTRWDSYAYLTETADLSSGHTHGPVDGSLYATVSKKKGGSVSPVLQNGGTETPPVNGLEELVEKSHTVSMDSGISSNSDQIKGHLIPAPSSHSPSHSGKSGASDSGASSHFVNSEHTVRTRVQVHPTPGQNKDKSNELDNILEVMLLDIESFPDYKSGQGTAVDLDRLEVDFSLSNPKDTSADMPTYSKTLTNGYSTSYFKESFSPAPDEDIPYHARQDSKPFSYGVMTNSPGMQRRVIIEKQASSPPLTRKNSDGLPKPPGLESPRLVRKLSGKSPAPSKTSSPFTSTRSVTTTYSVEMSPESVVEPPIFRETKIANSKSFTSSPQTPSFQSDESFEDMKMRPSGLSRTLSFGNECNSSWLQRQQQKLWERRSGRYRSFRQPGDTMLLSELKKAQYRMNKADDGYTSDSLIQNDFHGVTNEFAREKFSKTSPLHINTTYSTSYSSNTANQTERPDPYTLHYAPKDNSEQLSPVIPNRSSSRDRTVRYNQYYTHERPLGRQKSDTSFDRERPVVKRVYEQAYIGREANRQRSPERIISTSPSGHFTYSGDDSDVEEGDRGLLVTVNQRQENPVSVVNSAHSLREKLEELEHCLASLTKPTNSSNGHANPKLPDAKPNVSPSYNGALDMTDSIANPTSDPVLFERRDANVVTRLKNNSLMNDKRPVTPGFPVAPRTPYANNSDTSGLPPKSPTTTRKDRSPSPSSIQQIRSYTLHSSETHNGQSSPSVYFGHSRRSSVGSLNDSSLEIITHHPIFVKDSSRFWYKPSISREEAISMLKNKTPGTFVVRDSNSFPGAYGLALKVAGLPANVQSKQGDVSTELVRHYLIEPTSKGVRLKGCNNEPIFGSLSALVYQHSLTPLALPCKLSIPEYDPAGLSSVNTTNSVQLSSASHLLSQGAACNVLYLFTMDIESLTGPPAIRKTMNTLFLQRVLPQSVTVHFKVSNQGITLTDNERRLFFRRHYPANTVSFCGVDPDDRRWSQKNPETGLPVSSNRCFGFVARKSGSKLENQCHVFAELEPEQPASAIVNFISKFMMESVAENSNPSML